MPGAVSPKVSLSALMASLLSLTAAATTDVTFVAIAGQSWRGEQGEDYPEGQRVPTIRRRRKWQTKIHYCPSSGSGVLDEISSQRGNAAKLSGPGWVILAVAPRRAQYFSGSSHTFLNCTVSWSPWRTIGPFGTSPLYCS